MYCDWDDDDYEDDRDVCDSGYPIDYEPVVMASDWNAGSDSLYSVQPSASVPRGPS